MIQDLLNDQGQLTVLALDHRDSLRAEFPAGAVDQELVQFKIDVITAFGGLPSAVMLDPELSIHQVLEAGHVPNGVGTLCALEAQGYLDDPEAQTNELMWTPSQAKAAGASAAKLLVLYRPDRGSSTEAQDDLIRTAVAGCAQVGLPLLVEPVPYDLEGVEDREATILASVERIQKLGPDIIKMPFPSDAATPDRWRDACQAVDDVCEVPWAVLSWGAHFEVFVRQTRVACDNGASGFMAGRAIWKEAVGASDRPAFLRDTAIPRFTELVAATENARPIPLIAAD